MVLARPEHVNSRPLHAHPGFVGEPAHRSCTGLAEPARPPGEREHPILIPVEPRPFKRPELFQEVLRGLHTGLLEIGRSRIGCGHHYKVARTVVCDYLFPVIRSRDIRRAPGRLPVMLTEHALRRCPDVKKDFFQGDYFMRKFHFLSPRFCKFDQGHRSNSSRLDDLSSFLLLIQSKNEIPATTINPIAEAMPKTANIRKG